MIGFLREMFATPESQDDPYAWSATFGGHAWIALGPWGLMAIATDKLTATCVVPVLYFLIWEMGQFYFAQHKSRALFWDCVLDSVGVSFACVAAYYVGTDNMNMAIFAWGASVGVMGTGWRARL